MIPVSPLSNAVGSLGEYEKRRSVEGLVVFLDTSLLSFRNEM